ncbi:MAG TPA: hypothetical protein VFW28_17610 [Micropepsaceae bacterium]|nr:hypothetical protein [Micropepsaceae bacterium]
MVETPVNACEKTSMKTIEISGSHGTLTADANTGQVMHRTGDGDYSSISRFDLAEWQRTYPGETCNGGDILDFAYWTTDGHYEDADSGWREDFRANLRSGKIQGHAMLRITVQRCLHCGHAWECRCELADRCPHCRNDQIVEIDAWEVADG